MVKPRIYADFHNADSQGHLRLNCIGTIEDLAQQHIDLIEGLFLTLYSDDLDDQGQLDELRVDGVVSFSDENHNAPTIPMKNGPITDELSEARRSSTGLEPQNWFNARYNDRSSPSR